MSDKKLTVRIGAEISGLVKGLNDSRTATKGAQRQFDMMGAGLRSLAGAAAGLVTVSAVFRGITSSVEAANVQLQAVAAVESRLRSMGDAAGFTSGQLQKMASNLQQISLFGDEQILQEVTSVMLTFGRVAGEEFERAQKASLDLSAALGGSLQGAAMQVGKALQDPVQGLTALRRSGVSFSDEQVNLIKRLNETGRAAEAQRMILAELERQFGGAAESARRAGTGPIQGLKMAFGDMQEELGMRLLPALNEFAEILTAEMVSQENIDSVKMLGDALGNMIRILAGGYNVMRTTQKFFQDITGNNTPLEVAGRLLAGGPAFMNDVERERQEMDRMVDWMRNLRDETAAATRSIPAGGNNINGGGGDARKTLAQNLTEQLREQQQIQRDILRMGVDEYRTTLQRLSAITAVNNALGARPTEVSELGAFGAADNSAEAVQEAALAAFRLQTALTGLPTQIIMPESLDGVRLLNEEFNRMNFVLAQISGETAVALGEGLRGAFESSLTLVADSVVGLQKMTNVMNGLRDILKRFIADLAVAIARAAVLASLQSVFSPKSTFGALFAGALGIGGGVAPKMKVDMGTMTIRGSDIVASMNAELRLQSQAGA
jgi:hypothetical protein